MAITPSFSYTNTDLVPEGAQLAPVAVKPLTNYALIMDEPEKVILQNKTGDLDQIERVVFQKSSIKNVAISEPTPYPDTRSKCVQYGVKLEQYLRLKSSTDDTFIQDEPVTVTITFKHPQMAQVTSDVVADALLRALGALEGESPTATSLTNRINELMRGSLKPTK